MEIDLDEIAAAERLLPWDLTLKVGDRSHATVRPTLGLIARLDSKDPKDARPGEGTRAVLSIFADPKPDVGEWTGEHLGAAVAAYMVYFNQAILKNSPALVAAAKAAVARGSTSGA